MANPETEFNIDEHDKDFQNSINAFFNSKLIKAGLPPIEEDLVEDVPGWSLRRFIATAKRAHKDEHHSIGL